MRFAPEGRPFLLGAGALAALAWAVAWLAPGPWLLATGLVASVLLVFVAYFFRDPGRSGPSDATLVLAPADGRVIAVSEVEEPAFGGDPCRRISIFLSVFNVHVQRAPVSGDVVHKSYNPGRYLAAWNPKASADNEQATVGLATPDGRVVVRQIAGLIARRIVTYANEGDRVARGDRIGIIRFGSRVDLFVPLEWPLECSVGDTVRGGLTVMGRIAARAEPPPIGAPATQETRP